MLTPSADRPPLVEHPERRGHYLRPHLIRTTPPPPADSPADPADK